MCKAENIKGERFGRLEVIQWDVENHKWLCKCECGCTCLKDGWSLRGGYTKSCGCLKREVGRSNGARNKKHGCASSPLYHVWRAMNERCYNPNNQKYHRYGARGITVCQEWRESVKCFIDWALLHGYSHGLTIDRIDNNDGYSPENCHFVTNSENTNNRERTLKLYGLPLREWFDLRIDGSLHYDSFVGRIKTGWSLTRALTQKSQHHTTPNNESIPVV